MTREEAIYVLKYNYPSACFDDLCEAVEIAIQALSAPQEIVRCKDCFYAKPYNEIWTLPKLNCMWCKRYEEARPHDWFCADGERRTNE